jgi:PIN domain nuclease of toxin-antitoxin system
MRLLLDTHTFLWLVFGDPALSRTAKALLDDTSNELLLSIASPWEMAIKVGTGKLNLKRPVRDFVAEYLPKTRTALLPISLDHIAAVATLPPHPGIRSTGSSSARRSSRTSPSSAPTQPSTPTRSSAGGEPTAAPGYTGPHE